MGLLFSCSKDEKTNNNADNNTEISIIGQWLLEYDGQNLYCLLTFREDGIVRYQEYDHGVWEKDETYRYTFSNNLMIWTYLDNNYDVRESMEVISLTKDFLIFKDWPDGGVNKFVRI